MCYHGQTNEPEVVAHQPVLNTNIQQSTAVQSEAQGLSDRLDAAEQATGFKLGDIVKDQGSGEYGKVVGFGRINTNGLVAERVLLVEIAEDEVVVVHPTNLDFAGKLSA